MLKKLVTCGAIAATATLITLMNTGMGRAIVVVSTPSDSVVRYGSYSGVARIASRRTSGDLYTCTGSLLRGGLHILTAAHCVTDDRGNRNATRTGVRFVERSGTFAIASNGYYIYPSWRGNLFRGNDLAVLRLSQRVSGVQQYDIYRGASEVGRTFIKVGYGQIGIGNLGARPDLYGTGKLIGLNRFDGRGEDFVIQGKPLPGRQLLFDFDNGTFQNNFFIGSDLGWGYREINVAPGDSGSPSFISNQIAGVTSYRATFSAITDVDNILNSSFGEYASETRASFFQSFITNAVRGRYRSAVIPAAQSSTATTRSLDLATNDQTSLVGVSSTESPTTVPEPSSVLALAAGALGVGVLLRQRQTSASHGHSSLREFIPSATPKF